MKKTIIRYGLFGAFSGGALFLSGILLGHELDYSIQEVVGYVTIIAALSFIYFGIKHFRDRQNGGQIRFAQGVVIGLSITALVGLGIAVADYLYISVFNPNFAQEFLEVSIEKLNDNYSGQELRDRTDQLRKDVKAYGDSFSLALIMFVTVLIIGTAISIISSLVLKTSKKVIV